METIRPVLSRRHPAKTTTTTKKPATYIGRRNHEMATPRRRRRLPTSLWQFGVAPFLTVREFCRLLAPTCRALRDTTLRRATCDAHEPFDARVLDRLDLPFLRTIPHPYLILTSAVSLRRADLVHVILAKAFTPQQDHEETTHSATAAAGVRWVHWIRRRGRTVTRHTQRTFLAFAALRACEHNALDALKALHAFGVPLDFMDNLGILLAAERGHAAIVRFVCAASENDASAFRLSEGIVLRALLCATRHGQLDTIKILLGAMARCYLSDSARNAGMLAAEQKLLRCAATCGHVPVLAYLVHDRGVVPTTTMQAIRCKTPATRRALLRLVNTLPCSRRDMRALARSKPY